MFRTPISLSPVAQPISIRSQLLSWGSCFADFIGNELLTHKFKVTCNPCGIIFHPLAQLELFRLALDNELPPEYSYVCHQGIWYNYLFHSSISSHSRADLENAVEQKISQLRNLLTEADFILMTFGTAIQYRHKDTGLLVANCHKVPQREFEKSLTTPETIIHQFHKLFDQGDISARIILSVSPIRHLKEGIEQNCASKSVLRLVCEMLKNDRNTTYFPGYEIMLDDLRDYRFYQKDMIHPNQTARDYIWDLFTSNFLDQEAQEFVAQWQKITLNLNHRPFHPQSPAHQEFLKKTISLIQSLPHEVDTSKEIAMLKEDLNES